MTEVSYAHAHSGISFSEGCQGYGAGFSDLCMPDWEYLSCSYLGFSLDGESTFSYIMSPDWCSKGFSIKVITQNKKRFKPLKADI